VQSKLPVRKITALGQLTEISQNFQTEKETSSGVLADRDQRLLTNPVKKLFRRKA